LDPVRLEDVLVPLVLGAPYREEKERLSFPDKPNWCRVFSPGFSTYDRYPEFLCGVDRFLNFSAIHVGKFLLTFNIVVACWNSFGSICFIQGSLLYFALYDFHFL